MQYKKTCLGIDQETKKNLIELKKDGIRFYIAIRLGVKRLMEDYRKGVIDLKALQKQCLKTRKAI